MLWQAIVDFDGTITCEDTTDQILARFAGPGWEAIEDDWVSGRIGSRECMARQVELLRVLPAVLDGFTETIAIDSGFSAFVALCRRHDIPVTVVSDGLDRTIRAVLGRIGLGALPVIANHLAAVGGERWQLTSPHAALSGDCASGTCKCRVADGFGRPLTLLVGDGRSDFCLAGQADLVFAKKSLIGHCHDNALPHHPFSDFSEAVGLLEELLASPVTSGAQNQLKDMIHG